MERGWWFVERKAQVVVSRGPMIHLSCWRGGIIRDRSFIRSCRVTRTGIVTYGKEYAVVQETPVVRGTWPVPVRSSDMIV